MVSPDRASEKRAVRGTISDDKSTPAFVTVGADVRLPRGSRYKESYGVIYTLPTSRPEMFKAGLYRTMRGYTVHRLSVPEHVL